MSINLIVMLKAKKNKLMAFIEIMAEAKTDLPKIDGCESVKIFKDMNDPCVFYLIETWGSEEQHKSHIAEFSQSGGWEHMSSHLISDPVMSYFREI